MEEIGDIEEMRAGVRSLVRRIHDDERGLNTAELLGNAALAIAALVIIWGALQALGVDVVAWIGDQIGV
ncbi:MAG: hypothetical protein ACFCVC_19045 [Acidimicrobiia bacterium]